MCHVPHDLPWSRDGTTDVETGRLLCPRHHAMAHDPRRELRAVKNGRVVCSST